MKPLLLCVFALRWGFSPFTWLDVRRASCILHTMTHFVRPNYGHGCFADLPHLVKSLLTGQASATELALLGQSAAHQYDAVVLVLADAFGWRFFERFAEHDPFLQRFGQDGVVACWTSQFPSTTAAHVTCIHSGLPVAQHGVFEWQYYEPQLDAVIAPLMFSFAGTRQRETLKPTGITAEQLYPPQTFYQELAQVGVTSYVYQHRDYTPSTYSDWMYRGAHVSPYITLPEGLLNMRLQMAESPTPAYFLLYHDKIDAIGHVYGPDSPQIEAEIETFLFCMERAFMQPLLRESKNVLLILTADHGQTHVDPHTTIYLNRDPRLKRFQRFLRTDRKGDPLPPGGSPRDLFLYVRDAWLDEAQGFLAERLEGKAAVHKTQALIEQGIFGTQPLSPALLGRLGNLVVLPYAGESVWWYEKGKFEQKYYGHHGGLTPEEMEIPLCMYSFAKG